MISTCCANNKRKRARLNRQPLVLCRCHSDDGASPSPGCGRPGDPGLPGLGPKYVDFVRVKRCCVCALPEPSWRHWAAGWESRRRAGACLCPFAEKRHFGGGTRPYSFFFGIIIFLFFFIVRCVGSCGGMIGSPSDAKGGYRKGGGRVNESIYLPLRWVGCPGRRTSDW